MAQLNCPTCARPQSFCALCDCDDCLRLTQQEVKHNAARVPVASVVSAPDGRAAAASQSPPLSERSSWLSAIRTVWLVGVTGVAAVALGSCVAAACCNAYTDGYRQGSDVASSPYRG